jgi:hypothetical protein
LQRHCIDHCQLENSPHKDELTVELSRLIPSPEYSHLIQLGDPMETVDIYQEGFGSQQHEGR